MAGWMSKIGPIFGLLVVRGFLTHCGGPLITLTAQPQPAPATRRCVGDHIFRDRDRKRGVFRTSAALQSPDEAGGEHDLSRRRRRPNRWGAHGGTRVEEPDAARDGGAAHESGFLLMRLLIFPSLFLSIFSSELLPRATALSQVRRRTERV